MVIIGKVKEEVSEVSEDSKVVDLESAFEKLKEGKTIPWFESYVNTAIDLSDRGYDVYISDNELVRVYLDKSGRSYEDHIDKVESQEVKRGRKRFRQH